MRPSRASQPHRSPRLLAAPLGTRSANHLGREPSPPAAHRFRGPLPSGRMLRGLSAIHAESQLGAEPPNHDANPSTEGDPAITEGNGVAKGKPRNRAAPDRPPKASRGTRSGRAADTTPSPSPILRTSVLPSPSPQPEVSKRNRIRMGPDLGCDPRILAMPRSSIPARLRD
jgi:hypothetical protein